MKLCIKSLLIILALLLSFQTTSFCAFAEDGQQDDVFYVYDEYGNFLMEKSGVEENDEFLASDFSEWEIVEAQQQAAIARKKNTVKRPFVNIKSSVSKDNNKKICLYLTHNDESYLPTDGYYTIYGKGGVHDVAKEIKNELEMQNISVTLDETLHIPHDSKAYSRSKVTAQSLQNAYKPNGLFDIHRDATARSVYISKCNGKEISKIRIVVGKSNPNFEKNYAFAKEVFAVGQAMYPGLFLDIYQGKGNYNQSLQEHALLFEMGTYLIEKELVFESIPYLTNVLNTVLFNAQLQSNGDIDIAKDYIDSLEDESNKNNQNFDENNENLPKNTEKSSKNIVFPIIIMIIIIFSSLFLIFISIKNYNKKMKK